jgi:hypothetical protein
MEQEALLQATLHGQNNTMEQEALFASDIARSK